MVSQKNEEKDCYFSCRNGYEKCPRHTKEICGYCCAVRRKIRKGKHTLSHFGWWYRNIGRHLRVPFPILHWYIGMLYKIGIRK